MFGHASVSDSTYRGIVGAASNSTLGFDDDPIQLFVPLSCAISFHRNLMLYSCVYRLSHISTQSVRRLPHLTLVDGPFPIKSGQRYSSRRWQCSIIRSTIITTSDWWLRTSNSRYHHLQDDLKHPIFCVKNLKITYLYCFCF